MIYVYIFCKLKLGKNFTPKFSSYFPLPAFLLNVMYRVASSTLYKALSEELTVVLLLGERAEARAGGGRGAVVVRRRRALRPAVAARLLGHLLLALGPVIGFTNAVRIIAVNIVNQLCKIENIFEIYNRPNEEVPKPNRRLQSM